MRFLAAAAVLVFASPQLPEPPKPKPVEVADFPSILAGIGNVETFLRGAVRLNNAYQETPLPLPPPLVITPTGTGLRGMPFAPEGLSNEEKFKFYRQQAGLPAFFDGIGRRESGWTNTARNSCCWGALQQHQGNWRGTSYIRLWNDHCDAYSIWDIYGDSPLAWQKHMCTAKVMYDISGTQPWAQTR